MTMTKAERIAALEAEVARLRILVDLALARPVYVPVIQRPYPQPWQQPWSGPYFAVSSSAGQMTPDSDAAHTVN